jgi:hypothetical protein
MSPFFDLLYLSPRTIINFTLKKLIIINDVNGLLLSLCWHYIFLNSKPHRHIAVLVFLRTPKRQKEPAQEDYPIFSPPFSKFNPFSRHFVPLQDDEIEEHKGQGPPVKQLHAPGVGSGQRSHSFDQSTPPTSSKGRQWSGVPISHHIDIAAGHLLLAYIEENKYRFDKEWESLVSYQPEYVTSNTAVMVGNKHKNRYPDILPCNA